MAAWSVFPLVLGGALVGGWLAMRAGHAPDVVVAVASFGPVVLVALLERVLPFAREWNRSRGDVWTDLVHMTATVLIPEGLKVCLLALLVWAGAQTAATVGFGLWPTGWPLAIQVGAALLIGELGSYWFHRVEHELPLLWRIHAIHHSVERLYWLNSGRFHPLDIIGSWGVAFAPLVLLGITAEPLALATITLTVHGLFQHANVDARLGPLNWVFSGPELHRWHHSPVVAEGNTNYGATLIVWDVVFRSRFLPDRPPPLAVGIGDMPNFPQGYLAHVAVPFRWAAVKAEAAAAPTASASP